MEIVPVGDRHGKTCREPASYKATHSSTNTVTLSPLDGESVDRPPYLKKPEPLPYRLIVAKVGAATSGSRDY